MIAQNDSAEFIEQARWLLDWHNRRSEAFVNRAVAIIGFEGVLIGLLFQAAGLTGVHANWFTWCCLILAIGALLVAGIWSIRTIAGVAVAAPSVDQLRRSWATHAANPQAGTAGPQIAEDLLNSSQLDGVSAVSDAKADADRRGDLMAVAVWALLVAVVILSSLLTNVLSMAWGGGKP